MTPVDQTILHDPDTGAIGNCWQAAVATLLDLPLDDVPHFAAADDFDGLWHWWLHERRMVCMHVGLLDLPNDIPCLLVGTSPRDIAHIVVGIGTRMVHDPHPSRAGLKVTKHAWVICPYLPGDLA